jgi:hypothetical protein
MSKATRKNPAKRTPGAKASTSAATANSSKPTRSSRSKTSKPSKPAPKAAARAHSKNSSTTVTSPDWIDPLQPFHWRDDKPDGYPTDVQRKRAVDHICACLAQGGTELITIQYACVPRIASATLLDWRKEHPDWDAAIIDAFDAGGAVEMRKAQEIADGMLPLTYGKTTQKERAKHRADTKRDRLRIHVMFKRIEAVHRKYKPRTIMEGDDEHPLIPSKFEITPVRPANATDTPDDE